MRRPGRQKSSARATHAQDRHAAAEAEARAHGVQAGRSRSLELYMRSIVLLAWRRDHVASGPAEVAVSSQDLFSRACHRCGLEDEIDYAGLPQCWRHRHDSITGAIYLDEPADISRVFTRVRSIAKSDISRVFTRVRSIAKSRA
jgi:hypothetical protein